MYGMSASKRAASIANLFKYNSISDRDLDPRPYINKNTTSTPSNSRTQRARAYEVKPTSFLSTGCELSINPCSRFLYSRPIWPVEIGRDGEREKYKDIVIIIVGVLCSSTGQILTRLAAIVRRRWCTDSHTYQPGCSTGGR